MSASRLVLAGDIGGTKVNLGLFAAGAPAPQESRKFSSRDFKDLESICTAFLKGKPVALAAAAFGIAGPIVNGRTETTNLPWVIEQTSLQRLLSCPVAMLNDLESTAHGIGAVRSDELRVLNEGQEVPRAARAIIAAGTGLGEGYLVHDAACGDYVPAASEGGHADFAPRNAQEIEMLEHFLTKYSHVSVERVVSGMGISDIFEYLAATGRYEVPGDLRESVKAPDATAAISRSALDRTHAICVDTMKQFVASYGAEAGNLALKLMALGGVYIGGGIAPKILPLMCDGLFMESFAAKGRFAPLMRRIPVRIILNDRAALLGAASVASRLASPRKSHDL